MRPYPGSKDVYSIYLHLIISLSEIQALESGYLNAASRVKRLTSVSHPEIDKSNYLYISKRCDENCAQFISVKHCAFKIYIKEIKLYI